MSKISSLPDVSRYVRTVDRVHLNNTVKLVLGEEVIEVNGYIISLKSSVLEGLVCTQSEIFLDGFEGEGEGIQQCVELLYGGTVELNERNVKVIIKFAAIYKVEELVTLCLEWLKNHLSTDNLLTLIELGLLIQTEQRVLDLCRDYIAETVKDDFQKISEGWVFGESFVKFLVQYEILEFTLPVIVKWIEKDADVSLILDQVEARSLSLSNYGAKTSELFEKMSEKMGSLETSRRIVHYSLMLSKGLNSSERSVPEPEDINLQMMLTLEKDFGLNHFEYIGIVFRWISSRMSAGLEWRIEDLTKLWETVRLSELSMLYHTEILRFFNEQKVINCLITRDRFIVKGKIDYQCSESPLLVISGSPAKMTDEIKTVNKLVLSTASNPGKQILNGGKLIFPNVNCGNCGIRFDLNMRFVQTHNQYFEISSEDAHISSQHIQVATISKTGDVKYIRINSYNNMRKWIKRHSADDSAAAIICFYKCNRDTVEPQSPASSSKRRKTGD